MSETIRTTRECSVNQLNPNLLHALEGYFQTHKLGNLAAEALLSCETFTERKDRGKLAAWLEGNPDTTDYLGLILTAQWLLWARSGDRSGTIVAGANLKDIRVKAYASRLTKDTGLEISGYIGDSKGRVRGNLALGQEPAARKFCEEAIKSIEKANPSPKKRTIPWLTWGR